MSVATMDLFTFLCGVIALILVIIGSWYVYIRSYDYYFKSLPGPTPLPLLGNALEVRNTAAFLPVIQKYFKSCGNVYLVWISIFPFVIIADYDVVEKVLNSTKLIGKSRVYKFLWKWLGFGLLTSEGLEWKKRRKLLTPTYHFQILEQFVPIFDKVSNILVEELQKDKNKECVDVHPYMVLCTLDLICETAMGVPINALRNKTSPYVESVKEMSRIIMERILSPVQHFNFLYQFTENYRNEKKHVERIHSHTMNIIRERRIELTKQTEETITDNETDLVGSKRKVTFLDLLLKVTDNGTPLSDEDIREEVDTFMFAGHDTSASSISFALFEIAQHPEVQAKIYQEQQEIFSDDNREVRYQDLNNMKYLELVIKEALRLYPPVPVYAREAVEDTRINDDLILPKGSTIAVIPYQIHRDPKYYPNPELFDPDRFLPERNLGKTPYSFLPFSAGPRNCLGQKFAYLAMKSTLSKIIRHFELLPVIPEHKLKLVSEVILKSENGVMIKLIDRK